MKIVGRNGMVLAQGFVTYLAAVCKESIKVARVPAIRHLTMLIMRFHNEATQ
jgi:hypothetical protein